MMKTAKSKKKGNNSDITPNKQANEVAVTQQANVRTMYVHCTYKPVRTDLVRITFGMKVFWTYRSVCKMYVHSHTYNVCTYKAVPTLYVRSNTKTESKKEFLLYKLGNSEVNLT